MGSATCATVALPPPPPHPAHARAHIFANRRQVPWALDAKLAQAGAQMVTAPAPFQAHVVTDGRLITGQNPASALPLAQAAVRAMRGGAE